MDKWDKEEEPKSLIDAISHPSRTNFIFIDETDSESEQLKKISNGMKVGKTNIVTEKTW